MEDHYETLFLYSAVDFQRYFYYKKSWVQFFFTPFFNESEISWTNLTFTLSNSITETPEKGVKYVGVVLVFLLLTLNILHTFSSDSIFYFEQVNVNWEELHNICFWTLQSGVKKTGA